MFKIKDSKMHKRSYIQYNAMFYHNCSLSNEQKTNIIILLAMI